jgi:hypothetical protein
MNASIGRGILGRSVAGVGLAAVLVGGGSVAFADTVSGSATTAKSACNAARTATAGVQHETDTYKTFFSSSTVLEARTGFATLVTGWHRAVTDARRNLATPPAGSSKMLTAFLTTFRMEDEVLARAEAKAGTLPTESRPFIDARGIMTKDILAAARATDIRLARLQSAERRKVPACAAIISHERAFQTWRR